VLLLQCDYIYTHTHTHTHTQFFFMFLKEVSSAHQACNYLIKNKTKNSNIVKYYYNLKQWFSM